MEHENDLRAAGDRLQARLDELRACAAPAVWEGVEEVLALVTELYGAGLARVVEIARAEPDGGGPGLLEQLADDDLVATLLVLHGIHPLDLAGRVRRALDRVRPYLGSHGGDVEVLHVDGDAGVVRLRMLGSCDGCPSSSVTLELAVEQAIREAAPEIERIEVDGGGMPSDPGGGGGMATPVTLRRKPEPAEADGAGWRPVHGLHGLTGGRLEAVEVDGIAVVFCRHAKDLYAYVDACPACGAALHEGTLAGEVLACASCRASFDVRLAGRSLDGLAARLDPVPLLSEGGGTVRVAVPAGAAR